MSKSVALLLVLVFLMASCIIVVKPVEAPSATENSWTTMAPMPEASAGHGVAVANGKIYAFLRNVTYEYDPATDTWATKTPMPTSRWVFGIAVVENKIYVIGGSIGDYTYTGVNEVYDPATDTWETKTSMPTPRHALQASVVDGKIYLIGGGQRGPHYANLDVNEVYDPATDSWTIKTPISTGVQAYASAVVNNKIYVIGGSVTLNQIYDPETDTWSYGAPLPIGVDSAAAGATTGVAAPKRIYVIGGKQNLDPVNLNQVYDPETDTWSTGASMPTPRFHLGVAVVNDVLYAIGGILGWLKPVTAVNEQYTPIVTVQPPVDQPEPPSVYIVSPENKTYASSNISLVFTVNKPTSWLGYSLDGQDNVTITGNTTLSGLSSGLHNLTVYAKDEFENTGTSETISFSVAEEPAPEPFPTILVAAAAVASVAVVGLGLLVYFKKRKR